MSKTTHPKRPSKETHRSSRRSNQALPHKKKDKEKQPQPPPPPLPPQQIPSWAVMKSILTCKHLDAAIQEQSNSRKKCKKMRCSGSLCNNTKVMQRPDPPSPEIHQRKNRATPATSAISTTSNSSLESSSRSIGSSRRSTATTATTTTSSSSSSSGVLIKGMPFRRLSGCYECRMVVDPVLAFTRDPSLRTTICTCPHCGEVFMNPDNLDLHQAVRHAVSEVGPEDTTKNIVEIIFQSSWLRNQTPVCHIHRILKIQNTQKTINKFEEYRDSIKSKATKLPKKHPRCIADGNELLRFHSTTFMCSLGLNGSSNLCNSIPRCNVCSIIKNGFKLGGGKAAILTTATSGRAHDRAEVVVGPEGCHDKRAMLVCRVIAGRVKKTPEGITGTGSPEEYDSVAGAAGVYSDLDELYVSNAKAILPCFVVIYGGF